MYIADLHIHSKYSRATSRDCDAPHLDFWARQKGIGLVGTGDFTHPAWRQELRDCMEPAEDGLYRLKDEQVLPCGVPAPAPRFVVSGDQHHLQAGWQNPQGASCDSAAQSGRGG